MRVLPVAKRKSRRGPAPRHFLRKVCKKAKGTRGTANSASSGTLQSWQRAARNRCTLEKSRFFQKNTFFSQNTALVASWAPAAQGPSHDATFYASWAHSFYFCKLHTFSFFGTVSGRIAQEGPPNEFFCTFFGSVFGRACIRPRYVKSLRSGFFCNVKKVRSKGPIGYAAWGLPQGPAFACTVMGINKTKKQEQKKTSFVWDSYIK